MHIMNMQICGKFSGHTETCTQYNASLLRYVIDKGYASNVKTEIRRGHEPDGLTDSVRQLLISQDPCDRYLLNMPFLLNNTWLSNIVVVLITIS